ncbi:L-glyceraldehyde 3-phosphate reductase [Clostridium cibarium]|uniref:L-glyceraldehyde 3-phosphate reductase n=1 Tax=Clostridium cibarium TaxID=2762247 RepID=A0ABR8PRK9_9CLOT|nr:L-glyceraldehyde 3-phosphate reductase [Clostridium cibarium]MBD7910750.1 L-glyceraldehyde 3-phosphate reductase [Clostridium cibarium]
MKYVANSGKYSNCKYRRCGESGLYLPVISLGLWHNFGSINVYENSKNMILKAFDLGITHFDLANNYGPEPGSAEETFGKVLNDNLKDYRDEIVISTKAGYRMWKGPYGDGGGKKYLVSSLDQSLKRMGVDYVDIFYSHRYDKNTPIEETMYTLSRLVKQGKALYVGISSYPPEETQKAIDILKELKTPLLIHQPRYSMFDRTNEESGLFNLLKEHGVGSIVFCPLAQGLLTNKYINGIPQDSRANSNSVFLDKSAITEEKIEKVKKLNELAKMRNQTLAQMALAWILKGDTVTSAIIGASKMEQIVDCHKAMFNMEFTKGELEEIDEILAEKG